MDIPTFPKVGCPDQKTANERPKVGGNRHFDNIKAPKVGAYERGRHALSGHLTRVEPAVPLRVLLRKTLFRPFRPDKKVHPVSLGCTFLMSAEGVGASLRLAVGEWQCHSPTDRQSLSAATQWLKSVLVIACCSRSKSLGEPAVRLGEVNSQLYTSPRL